MISDWGARGSRPHIVFLLVDDWGWDLMPRQPDFRDAVHDRDLERLLPTVSRLFARDGLALERHYAMMYCAPSRQSLLSGRWPVHSNEVNTGCRGVPLKMRTLADKIKEGGYATHFVGKWHAGFASPQAGPTMRGFDTSTGFYLKQIDHFKHCSHAKHACMTAPLDVHETTPLIDFFVGSC